MNQETKHILSHIELYLATGVIHDGLVPFYDQHGQWHGAPSVWWQIKRNPRLERIKSSHLPASRRTYKDRTGTILRTSFVWRSKASLQLKYSAIKGSLLVNSKTNIHAACLRHIHGSMMTTADKRVHLPNLRTVGGDVECMHTFDLQVPRLQHVGGRAKVLGNVPPHLTSVGGSLGVYWCFTAVSKHLMSVGGHLCLTKAEAVRFSELTNIGGGFLLTLLTYVVHAPKLQSIGGDFIAGNAHDLRMPALRKVGGNVDTSAAKGFYGPRIAVGGDWTTYPGDVEYWHRRDAARKVLKCEDILL